MSFEVLSGDDVFLFGILWQATPHHEHWILLSRRPSDTSQHNNPSVKKLKHGDKKEYGMFLVRELIVTKLPSKKEQKQEKCDSECLMSAAVLFIKLGRCRSWWSQTAHPNSSHSLQLSPSPASFLCFCGPVLSASLPASLPIFLVTCADSFINPINVGFSVSST